MMYVVTATDLTETTIGGVPAAVWGPDNDRVVVAVHGAYGHKADPLVRNVAEVACSLGHQVVSVDLPGHGSRTDSDRLVPWDCAPELRAVYDELQGHGRYETSLVACSLGAYFSLLALPDRPLARTLLLSPLVDMAAYIGRLMAAHSVTEERLRAEGTIPLPHGQELSWRYLTYAREHPVSWGHPTRLLWGEHDALIPEADIDRFAALSGAVVERLDAGHAFEARHDALVSAWLAEGLA